MSRTNVVGLIYMTDMMCREVTTHAKKKKALASRHDGRKQNSYCLNRPLVSPFVSALLIQLIFSTISRNSTDFLRRRNVYISLLNLMFISQNWVEIFEYIMNPESCDAKSGYFYPVT